LMREK